jgi:hypothetical protein
MPDPTALVDPLSVTSLYLKLLARGHELYTGTGFVVRHDDRLYLVTNHHILGGRDVRTGKALSATAALPDEVRIAHHEMTLGTWRFVPETLNGPDGLPRWIQHPLGRVVDIAALELLNPACMDSDPSVFL